VIQGRAFFLSTGRFIVALAKLEAFGVAGDAVIELAAISPTFSTGWGNDS
jgi:hypothetical protein